MASVRGILNIQSLNELTYEESQQTARRPKSLRPGAAGSGTHTHSDTGPDGHAPGTAHPCGRADIHVMRHRAALSPPHQLHAPPPPPIAHGLCFRGSLEG